MTDFNAESSRITKNFEDFFNVSLNAAKKLFNFGVTGTKALQVGSIGLYWGVAALVQVAFAPMFFSWLGNSVLSLANSNSILAKLVIQLGKDFSYFVLRSAMKIPLVGGLFSQAVLPWVVTGVIGVLFASNLYQVINEQNKVIRQQVSQLEQQAKDNPDNLELQQQLAEIKTSLGYLKFYALTVASSGFVEANKAFPMRFVLSIGVPAFTFYFGCLCGVQPGIALSTAISWSWAGYILPYGVIGALGAINNAACSIKEIISPVDHNKVRTDKAALEQQQALLEQQGLDSGVDRGNRLTDEPPVVTSQPTNNSDATPPDMTPEEAKEAEELENRRQVLEAVYRRNPIPGKTAEEAAQEALQRRPASVTFTQVSPPVEPSVANAGQQPANTDTAKPSDKPAFFK